MFIVKIFGYDVDSDHPIHMVVAVVIGTLIIAGLFFLVRFFNRINKTTKKKPVVKKVKGKYYFIRDGKLVPRT